MHRVVVIVLIVATVVVPSSNAPAQGTAAPGAQPGVRPVDAWTCPLTHPIKGNFTTYSGEPCIYHVPGGRFYDKTNPERCYASETEARQDGCRRSKV